MTKSVMLGNLKFQRNVYNMTIDELILTPEMIYSSNLHHKLKHFTYANTEYFECHKQGKEYMLMYSHCSRIQDHMQFPFDTDGRANTVCF